ncbi:DtxR family transcriptional regulator [Cellulomonas soli]|uniref:Manganese transport regulator n=1 Tax=Cellulomonas soli TaxID=931535 RepID=A0A512PDN6_9CELL|nr:DtxR family Mn-dependent transcriptional regulator [Cellulomonas soli]GEP69232.1 DtxR family transcriptional regulator [Cellulomonas soli]
MSPTDPASSPSPSPSAPDVPVTALAPLSAVTQDYLKVVWSAREWSDRPVTTKLLATRLGVGASTVSETVRRLADSGLVTHEPYGAVELTELGRGHALAMVRRHRLVETFLVEVLGYGWDEVHDEAEVLEHAVSDLFVERLAERLGHPSRDPHGDPIPAADGTIDVPDAHPLWDVTPGQYAVARISDEDPGLLRYLDQVGLVLDAPVALVERRTVTGVVSVRLAAPGQGATVDLGEVAASAIWVVRA